MLQYHQEYALGYINDICIYFKECDQHLLHLEKDLIKFKDIGMTQKLKKLLFCKTDSSILGLILGSRKMSVVSDKITTIKALPDPSTNKLLRSILGLCNYYRNFSLLFSDTAALLT